MTRRLCRSFAAGLGVLALISGCSIAPDASEDSPSETSASATSTSPPEDTQADTAAETAADSASDTAAATTGDGAGQTSTGVDDAATSSSEAASAPVTSADGAFTFETPSGWSDVSSEAGAEAVAAVRADDRAAGFFTNLVVVAEDPIADLEDSIKESKKTLAGADGAATQTEQIQVDGETGFAFRVSRTVQDVDIVQAQRWFEHDGVLYILTLSSARTQRRAALDDLEAIMRTWSWQ